MRAPRDDQGARLPADLVRDLEWRQRNRPPLIAFLMAQIKAVLVKERNPKLRYREDDDTAGVKSD